MKNVAFMLINDKETIDILKIDIEYRIINN